MKESNSSTLETTKHLMSTVAEMKKEDQLFFGANIMELIRDGMLFILIRWIKNQHQASTRNSISPFSFKFDELDFMQYRVVWNTKKSNSYSLLSCTWKVIDLIAMFSEN